MNAQIPAEQQTTVHHHATVPSLRALTASLLGVVMLAAGRVGLASPEEDRAAVAALDTLYQDAVRRNDAEVMDRILAEDFVLVTGLGKTYDRDDLLGLARNREVIYERQDEVEGTQTVRMYGEHTAIVTALLWMKGTQGGEPFDYKLWFSDTYVRTAQGWRYAFGQAAQRIQPGS